MATPKVKNKGVALPGSKLGFPMYHAVSGNLPVLTSKFHHPADMADGATLAPSEYEYMTGNLPVLSTEFMRAVEDDLMPGWVQLTDPVTKRKFWWNIYYRSRRELKPAPHDDGRRGRNRGEAEMYLAHAAYRARHEGHTPVASPVGSEVVGFAASAGSTPAGGDAAPSHRYSEKFSVEHGWRYYIDHSAHSSSWERPGDFDSDGEPYVATWEERWDADAKAAYWVKVADGSRVDVKPPDFDGYALVMYCQQHVDAGTGHPYFWNPITGEHAWTAPPGWPMTPPTVPPPAPPTVPVKPAASASASSAPPSGASSIASSATAGGSAEDDEEDDTIIFPDFRGYLKKKGGGTSWFGSTTLKERYVVLRRGVLTYYENQDDWDKSKDPRKGVMVTMRYYAVELMPDSPVSFAIVPLPPEVVAGIEASTDRDDDASPKRKAGPRVKRMYEFEAPSKEMKVRWVKTLRGRRADGRHRADSPVFQRFYDEALASSRALMK